MPDVYRSTAQVTLVRPPEAAVSVTAVGLPVAMVKLACPVVSAVVVLLATLSDVPESVPVVEAGFDTVTDAAEPGTAFP